MAPPIAALPSPGRHSIALQEYPTLPVLHPLLRGFSHLSHGRGTLTYSRTGMSPNLNMSGDKPKARRKTWIQRQCRALLARPSVRCFSGWPAL